MTNIRQTVGSWGEARAAEYLTERGYHLVARNARTSYGELDLVFRQDDVTVFVEVKTRRSQSLGPPEISVTPQKRLHLIAAAQAFLLEHPELDGLWRIDVISIIQTAGAREIVHFENAITE
jgi:putative endonuclease